MKRSSFIAASGWQVFKAILAMLILAFMIYTLYIGFGMLGNEPKYGTVSNLSQSNPGTKLSGRIDDVVGSVTVNEKCYYVIKTEDSKYVLFYPDSQKNEGIFIEQLGRYNDNRNNYSIEYDGETENIDDEMYTELFKSAVDDMSDEIDPDKYYNNNIYRGNAENLIPFSKMDKEDYDTVDSRLCRIAVNVENCDMKPKGVAIIGIFGVAVVCAVLIIILMRKQFIGFCKIVLYHMGVYKVEPKLKPDAPLETEERFTDAQDGYNGFFDKNLEEMSYKPIVPKDAPKNYADEYYDGTVDESGRFYNTGSEEDKHGETKRQRY